MPSTSLTWLVPKAVCLTIVLARMLEVSTGILDVTVVGITLGLSEIKTSWLCRLKIFINPVYFDDWNRIKKRKIPILDSILDFRMGFNSFSAIYYSVKIAISYKLKSKYHRNIAI